MGDSQRDISGNPLTESSCHNVARLKISSTDSSKERSLCSGVYDDTRVKAEVDID